nr:hypothetical protein [Tanacetum cinerariifolium]
MVKEKQEKNKIGTKPDKNEKRRKAQQCRSPVTVEKVEKKKKIQSQGTNNAKPRSCIDSRILRGLELQFCQTSTQRAKTASFPKLLGTRTGRAITLITLKG